MEVVLVVFLYLVDMLFINASDFKSALVLIILSEDQRFWNYPMEFTLKLLFFIKIGKNVIFILINESPSRLEWLFIYLLTSKHIYLWWQKPYDEWDRWCTHKALHII